MVADGGLRWLLSSFGPLTASPVAFGPVRKGRGHVVNSDRLLSVSTDARTDRHASIRTCTGWDSARQLRAGSELYELHHRTKLGRTASQSWWLLADTIGQASVWTRTTSLGRPDAWQESDQRVTRSERLWIPAEAALPSRAPTRQAKFDRHGTAWTVLASVGAPRVARTRHTGSLPRAHAVLDREHGVARCCPSLDHTGSSREANTGPSETLAGPKLDDKTRRIEASEVEFFPQRVWWHSTVADAG